MVTNQSLPFFLIPAVLFTWAPVAQAGEPFRFPTGRYGDKAEMQYINRIPVLVVAGSPEEMGEAVGVLAVRPSKKPLEYPLDLLRFHKAEAFWNVFVQTGRGMFRQFPEPYRQELEALVRGGQTPQDPVVVGNTLFDIKKVFACSALLIDAGRSSTGGPLLGRNLDYPSLGYIHQYSLVTVYRPTGKHAFASVGFPGLVGVVSGMNDAGLALGVLEVLDVKKGEPEFDLKGLPYALCYRKVLEECTTIAEAKKLLSSLRRTTTTNLVVADKHDVAVLEITPGHVVQRPADGGVCICTNHYCTPELKPAEPLNPNGSFERFDALARVRLQSNKVTPNDLRGYLDDANLGDLTLQTMVFEPATLRLHLAVGQCPASSVPFRVADLAPLLKGKK